MTIIVSTVLCNITADATMSLWRKAFCCSFGSFSQTPPPKSSHLENAWYCSILLVCPVTSWRISLLLIQRSR